MTMTIAGIDHSGYYVGRGNKKKKKTDTARGILETTPCPL